MFLPCGNKYIPDGKNSAEVSCMVLIPFRWRFSNRHCTSSFAARSSRAVMLSELWWDPPLLPSVTKAEITVAGWVGGVSGQAQVALWKDWIQACLSTPEHFGLCYPLTPNWEWGLADGEGGSDVVKAHWLSRHWQVGNCCLSWGWVFYLLFIYIFCCCILPS